MRGRKWPRMLPRTIFWNFSCQPRSKIVAECPSDPMREHRAGKSLEDSQQASGHVDDCELNRCFPQWEYDHVPPSAALP